MPARDFSLSIESRKRNPYRSVIAATLFQSFRDALKEAADSLPKPQKRPTSGAQLPCVEMRRVDETTPSTLKHVPA